MTNNEIMQQNRQSVNDFCRCYGEDTAREMSQFLFDMMGLFARSEGHGGDQYTEDCVVKFTLLHTLVSNINEVEKVN